MENVKVLSVSDNNIECSLSTSLNEHATLDTYLYYSLIDIWQPLRILEAYVTGLTSNIILCYRILFLNLFFADQFKFLLYLSLSDKEFDIDILQYELSYLNYVDCKKFLEYFLSDIGVQGFDKSHMRFIHKLNGLAGLGETAIVSLLVNIMAGIDYKDHIRIITEKGLFHTTHCAMFNLDNSNIFLYFNGQADYKYKDFIYNPYAVYLNSKRIMV